MAFIDGSAASYPISITPLGFLAWGVVGTWSAAPISPLTGDRIPMLNPDLRVLIDAEVPPSEVQWELDNNSDFSSPLFTDTDTGVADGVVTKIVTTTLTDLTTYYWRVRAGDGVSAWSAWATNSFTVDLNVGRGYGAMFFNTGNNPDLDDTNYGSSDMYSSVSATWDNDEGDTIQMWMNVHWGDPADGSITEQMYWGDVSTNTPTPHIWWLKPNSGRSGDGIQIVCFGVGDLQATFSGVVEMYKGLSEGWVGVPINSWQAYPASPNAYTADRTIDDETMVIDPQHQILEITVPAGSIPPGYSLRIKTNGP